MNNFRIGFGYDVHQLVENRPFWLGGVLIPHIKGALGYSDADVLIHAICDALLGAANLGDIGKHFPDTDKQYNNIDSKILLARVIQLLHLHNFKVGNVDSTICLQSPKIASYIEKMQDTLAAIMNINVSEVSIKATTTEKLGFVGREDGVAAYAVVLIYKS